MAILGIQDLLNAEQEGRFAMTPRLPFSPFSVDLCLGNLYRPIDPFVLATAASDTLSTAEFIERHLEEIIIPTTGIIIHDSFYLWQPHGEIMLGTDLAGEITSRSSWARLGLRAAGADDEYLHAFHKPTKGRPLCTLRAQGTSVRVRHGDSLAQLFVLDGADYWNDSHLYRAVQDEKLKIMLDGRLCSPDNLSYNSGIVLTMAPEIWLYTGGVLEPGQPQEQNFEKVTLQKPLHLPQGSFFISASAEYVQIDPAFVGYVVERDPALFLLPFQAHSNAPYIGPTGVFEGRITFENHMVRDGLITAGMVQSKLTLLPLAHPLHPPSGLPPSRYHGQDEATLSK